MTNSATKPSPSSPSPSPTPSARWKTPWRWPSTIGVPVLTVDARELDNESYAANPANRCYFCKAELFTHLSRVASERGIRWIAYGANHDDLGDYRPGQQAAQEWGARAPLLEAGLTKAEIRHLSKALGLPTWDKPALACLSSRFPYGTRITAALLGRLDAAEDFLRHDLGFRQVRVRHHDAIARLEVDPAEMNRLLDPDLRQQISDKLKSLGYTYVAVELRLQERQPERRAGEGEMMAEETANEFAAEWRGRRVTAFADKDLCPRRRTLRRRRPSGEFIRCLWQ